MGLFHRSTPSADSPPPSLSSRLVKKGRPQSDLYDDSPQRQQEPLSAFIAGPTSHESPLPSPVSFTSPTSVYSQQMSQQDHGDRGRASYFGADPEGPQPGRPYDSRGYNSSPARRQSYSQQPNQQQQQQQQPPRDQFAPPAGSLSSRRPPSSQRHPNGQSLHSSNISHQPQPHFGSGDPSLRSSPATSNTGHGSRFGSPIPSPAATQEQSTRPVSQMGPPKGAPSTIAGEPLHDLGRAVSLLKTSKFYAEGFLLKRVEVAPDGKVHPNSSESQWAKWFVQLSGTIMSTWNAAEMEEAARENRTVPPQYLNLSDAFLHPFPPSPRGAAAPTPFQFALNSAGLNRLLFCAPSEQSLTMWINAIRLAGWERSRCNEIYTGSLLGLREPKPMGWAGFEDGLASKGKFEGWLKARLPGDTEWRRVWTVILRGAGSNESVMSATKKSRRSSMLSGFGRKAAAEVVIDDLPGGGTLSTIAFYAGKPAKKEQPLCIAQHVFYVAAIFPESEKLIDISSLFKIEGTFLNPMDGFKGGWGVGGRAEKQGFALLMLDEGDALAMLHWIVGLSDAFKLYGRPRAFSFDPRDPSSLYFALPVGPHRDRQFLDRELVDTLDVNESRPRAIRAVFHNILFDRMRGIRPAALGPPAPLPSESGNRAVAQPLRAQNSDQQDDYPQRNASPRLPPILPPIGEGSAGDSHDEPAMASPQQQLRSPPQASTQDYRASGGVGASTSGQRPNLEERPHSRSETGDTLANYTNFLTSDISREPTPPPQTQAFRTSTFSPPLSSMSTSPAMNTSPSTTNFSRPIQREAVASPADSEITHLTYAAPSSRPYDATAIQPQPVLSPIYSPPTSTHSPSTRSDTQFTQLTSPGGPTTSHAPPERADTQFTHLTSPGAPPSEPVDRQFAPLASPGAASSVGLNYRRLGHEPSTQEPLNQQDVSRHGSPALPSVVGKTSVARSVESVPSAPASTVSQGSRASDKFHNGMVVDSPENLPLSSPIDDNYATTPLFSPPSSKNGTGPAATNPLQLNTTSLPTSAPSDTRARDFAFEEESSVPAQPEATKSVDKAPPQSQSSYDLPQEYNIHSDLLAALDFVERTESPPPTDSPYSVSSVEPSPVISRPPYRVGPPPRGNGSPAALPAVVKPHPIIPTIVAPPSPIDEEYNSSVQERVPTPVERVPTPSNGSGALPSTFAKNKRAEERVAAAQLAQQAQHEALTRPGRSKAAGKGKQRAWVDSDEDEDTVEEEDDSDDDASAPKLASSRELSPPTSRASPVDYSQQPGARLSRVLPTPPGGQSQEQYYASSQARQSYYDNGPEFRASPPPPSHFDESTSRSRAFVNPHGLLHAGILEKEERSARAMEHEARNTGGPLVSIPSKPPPPQTGLVGAITSHQREKERTGGVGRAITEQQRERKLAEQRQQKFDETQRQQLQQQQQMMMMQQMQMQQQMQYGGGYPGMMNPWMTGGMMGSPYGGMMGSPVPQGPGSQFGGMGSPAMGSPVPQGSGSQFGGPGQGQQTPDPQQHAQQQAQQQAQQMAAMAAQQAYMAAMAQFSQPPATSPGGSPPLAPSFPSMSYMGPAYFPPAGSPPLAGSPSFQPQAFPQFAAPNPFPYGYGATSPPGSMFMQQPPAGQVHTADNSDVEDIAGARGSSPFAGVPSHAPSGSRDETNK